MLSDVDLWNLASSIRQFLNAQSVNRPHGEIARRVLVVYEALQRKCHLQDNEPFTADYLKSTGWQWNARRQSWEMPVNGWIVELCESSDMTSDEWQCSFRPAVESEESYPFPRRRTQGDVRMMLAAFGNGGS